MNCIICLEDLNGPESNSDEVWCNNHATHTDCLFQWCQKQKLSVTSTQCIACKINLTSTQQGKLISHQSVFLEKVCEVARKDEIKELKVFLNQKRLWSADCYIKLIRTALSSKSYRVLPYLRHVAGIYLTYRERENFVIELFGDRTEMNVRWILNNFDQTFQVPQINNEAEFLDLINAHERFPEHLWAFRANYSKFPESLQFQYTLNIFRTQRDTSFEYRDSRIPFYRCDTYNSLVLYNIAVRFKENCCHVMSRSLPYVLMKEFDPFDARHGIQRLLMCYVESCPVCSESHIRDAILLAIQEQEIEFLQYLLTFFDQKTKPPISTLELVQLILKLDRREEIMETIVKFKRWKEVKKLKRLYDSEIRKSRARIRFWSLLVA